jgi:hypothetical protein
MSNYAEDQDRFMRALEEQEQFIELQAKERAWAIEQTQINKEWMKFDRHVERLRKAIIEMGGSGKFWPELEQAVAAEVIRRADAMVNANKLSEDSD